MPQDTQETDWIQWQGGECPVDPQTRVAVMMGVKEPVEAIDTAECFLWQHTKDALAYDYHITRYRVISL